MANVVVVGSQWGDEGKGKIVDWLASRADAVVRFQGGHNAGHTLVVGEQVYKLSLLPSGIVRGTLSVIGNGVVLDPWHLKAEIAKLEGQGVVMKGVYHSPQDFEATQVLAKHDERYMPREVTEQLKKSGEWRPDGQAGAYQ